MTELLFYDLTNIPVLVAASIASVAIIAFIIDIVNIAIIYCYYSYNIAIIDIANVDIIAIIASIAIIIEVVVIIASRPGEGLGRHEEGLPRAPPVVALDTGDSAKHFISFVYYYYY